MLGIFCCFLWTHTNGISKQTFRFGDKYANLTPRVLNELCVATGADRPLATRYGGFVAISLFGPRAIASFLLPLAIEFWNQWEQTLDATTNLGQRMELQMCQQAILVRIMFRHFSRDSRYCRYCEEYESETSHFFVLPNFLQNSLGEFLGQGAVASQASQTVQMGWNDLEETFGDRLVMLYNEDTDYALCAI